MSNFHDYFVDKVSNHVDMYNKRKIVGEYINTSNSCGAHLKLCDNPSCNIIMVKDVKGEWINYGTQCEMCYIEICDKCYNHPDSVFTLCINCGIGFCPKCCTSPNAQTHIRTCE